ncbi:pilus assembly protein N-terminal domain-containing protein [Hyphomicrobium sp. D-2]|uniref:pilus assembly protein N-terminal domain-containing protein n=1 Tax=Hyphomicrobium sp. D-2 TaxID=3041621 RepID=UPI002455232C|nr:pilus assembly protein N-terminal domain-containing protein [Hyphomicrobium sp. D-2]MDH4980968.1 pilus assembly protein N-terminal domain-containing protein [Hyphomicrobium sp. D-2]
MTRFFRTAHAAHYIVAAATVVGAGCISSNDATAADLMVRYDQSQLLRLPRPVSEVIIGNPSIADVSVQGGNLLVVTGKAFGITNIIALDADRNVIQDQRVVVDQDDRRTVVVYRGEKRQTYTCAPNCSPAIIVGDDITSFDALTKAVQAKRTTSNPNTPTQNE